MSKTLDHVTEVDSPRNNGEPELRMIPREKLVPWPDLNSRTRFDAQELEELAASIREQGLLEPLLVTEAHEPEDGESHWIVAGERRYRAAGIAELEELPCIVREIDHATATAMVLIENLQRSDLTPIEEARGIRRYMDAHPGVTQAEVGERLGGYSQGWVSNRLRLLEIPGPLQELVQEGVINASAARDYLVPFTKLDPEFGAPLFKALGKELREAVEAEDGPLSDHGVRDIAAELARSLSRPVSERMPNNEWDGSKSITGYVTPEDHEACECGAPSFPYNARSFGSIRSTERCFDLDWWNGANSQGKERYEAEQEKRQEEQAQEAEADLEARVEAFEWPDREKVVPGETFYDAFDVWSDCSLLANSEGPTFTELVNPSGLDPERIYLVDSRHEDEGIDVVYLGDRETVGAAKEAASDAVRKEVERRRRARGEADAKAVEDRVLDEEDLVALFSGGNSAALLVVRVLEDLGIAPDGLSPYDSKSMRAALQELDRSQMFRVAKIAALRIRRNDGVAPQHDPLYHEVKEELREGYLAELEELVPGGHFPWREDEPEEEDPAPGPKPLKRGDRIKSREDGLMGYVLSVEGSRVNIAFEEGGELAAWCSEKVVGWNDDDGHRWVHHFEPVKGFEQLLEEAREAADG